MFDRSYIRYIIAVVWIIAFIVLWNVFNYSIVSGKVMFTTLDNLEQSIINKNWNQASQHLNDLKKNWEKSNLAIQSNNGTSEVNELQRNLSKLETDIKYQEDDALEYIGDLRHLLNSLTTVFPEP